MLFDNMINYCSIYAPSLEVLKAMDRALCSLGLQVATRPWHDDGTSVGTR